MNESIEKYLGEDVIDAEGTSFGTCECFWLSEDSTVAFVGIKTAGNPTQTSIVPAAIVEMNCTCLRVETHRELVQHGPSLPCDDAIGREFEFAVHDYYGTPHPVQIRRGKLRKKTRSPVIELAAEHST
jgi:hypothetical protein